MITDEQKFRAGTFRMFGFILLTPIGKVLLDPWIFLEEHNLMYGIIYIMIAIASGYIGLLHIERARVILDKRSKKRWMN